MSRRLQVATKGLQDRRLVVSKPLAVIALECTWARLLPKHLLDDG